MSNHKLIFLSTDISGLENEMEVFYNALNEVSVSIKEPNEPYPLLMSFDKATSIKLIRVLKAQVSKIEEEGSNG